MGAHGMDKIPGGMLTPAEASERLVRHKIHTDAARLSEMADAGYLPCYRWEQDGPALFRISELKRWFLDNKLHRSDGAPFPTELTVMSLADSKPAVCSELPKNMQPLAAHVRSIDCARMSGVYFLVRDGEVIYVGQSVSIYSRIAQHHGTRAFDRSWFIPVPASDLNAVEGAFIRWLMPSGNGNLGHGNGSHDAAILAGYGATK